MFTVAHQGEQRVGSLLQELKRRNVFRVGVAYVIVSWLIVQVIETISEPLGLPDWTEAFFIVLVLAGLPLVILFAWAFELTPEGLKKTGEVDKDSSVTANTGRKLNYAIIGVLVVALAFSLWDRQSTNDSGNETRLVNSATEESQQAGMTSIAVLPFVNMSPDPNQEYFSDGISEELLNLLAKIPELRVPARTSSFQFKGQNIDIAKVAEQLNVAHVLEGSVRRADVRVRVTAQLIEAKTGYHLWSETYDRELTDIFAIQDEISLAIVTALSETLGLKTAAVPLVKAAASPEAYNAYLLGQHLIQKRTKQDIEASIPNYELAIELDPNYAPAHTSLGLAWYLLTASQGTYGTMTLEASLSKALPHVEKALQLDPDSPEAGAVMGLLLDARGRVEEAIPYFERALSVNPSLTSVRNWYSNALISVGRNQEAFRERQKAYELDPLSILTVTNYANNLLDRRRFDDLRPIVDRLAQLDPARASMLRGGILVAQRKAAESAIHVFRGIDLDTNNLRHRSQAAFVLLALGLDDDALLVWPYPDNIGPIISNGDDLEYALELAQSRYADDPNNPEVLSSLAWAHWIAGNRDEGLKLAGRYLNTLGAIRRPIDDLNFMFILDAWQRGDHTALSTYLQPMEKNIEAAVESGVDLNFLNLVQAVYATVRDESDRAYEYLDKSMSNGILIPAIVTRFYEFVGWNELPRFVARKALHDEYRVTERRKFLAVACGSDGFVSWQPSPETCAEIVD